MAEGKIKFFTAYTKWMTKTPFINSDQKNTTYTPYTPYTFFSKRKRVGGGPEMRR
jgi:hypothetical protein